MNPTMLFRPQALRSAFGRAPVRCLRLYSTEAPKPNPILSQFREDLKAAMKAKDTSRLNVLRALLSDISNHAKELEMMKPPRQLMAGSILKVIMRNVKKAETALEEAQKAGREDLVERETTQLNIMKEYMGGIKTASPEAVKAKVAEILEAMQKTGSEITMNSLIKTTMEEMEAQNPLKKDVADAVRRIMKKARNS